MLVALGLPVLVGGSGLAVDTAQWYMWKGDLQYAADQAAIAGAWARTKDATEASYSDRAVQEFDANIQVTTGIASEPTVTLANWATGTLNSVVVTASASKQLPFSYFLTGQTATVTVSAQAAFERGMIAPACLVAVDEHENGAITIGGSAEFIAGCGIKALSDAGKGREGLDCEVGGADETNPLCHQQAIRVEGNPTIHAGSLIAEGAIDDWFYDTDNDNNIDNHPIPYADELVDDFADLEPPSPPQSLVPRVYDNNTCPHGQTTTAYIADSVATRTQITYTYWSKSGNTYSSYNYTGSEKKESVDDTVTATQVTLAAMPAGGANAVEVTGPTDSGYVQVDTIGTGQNRTKVYEKQTTTITKTYTNARLSTTATTSGGAAVLLPGTYQDLTIRCDTVFTSGVYILEGGMLEIHSQYNVTGAGVMFVLKDGAGIIVNGGADVNLTAMTVAELQNAGVSYDDAVKLDGMLVFEDRDSAGNDRNKINGDSNTILNGTIYLPVSNLDIQGSAGVTSQCLLLVASTITITGNVQMESFCPPNEVDHAQETQLPSRVRLVS